MTICDYIDRLEIENNNLVRIVTATSRKDSAKSLDIYKEYENGDAVCRNLYYSMYGYRVGFPGEKNSLYRNNCLEFDETLESYGECKKIDFYSRKLTAQEKLLVANKYIGFSYILKKHDLTINTAFKILRIWHIFPEIEFVLDTGFEHLALNKAFWRLTESKRKDVLRLLMKRGKKYNLSDVLTIRKYKLSDNDFCEYKSFCNRCGRVSFDVYKYLCKIGRADYQGRSFYSDYKALLKQTDHKGDYWTYPKDLQKKHDDLRLEIERRKMLEESEKLSKKQEKYTEAVKKLLSVKITENGYSVYVPESVQEIKAHADKLHQCLISCDYIEKVCNRKCVLVFVVKNREPVATAELLSGDKIGQFYANELDRNNCLPSDEVRQIVNKWIELKRCA